MNAQPEQKQTHSPNPMQHENVPTQLYIVVIEDLLCHHHL